MQNRFAREVAVLVPAAGKSLRMGSPKALLPFCGSTFIETILKMLVDAGFVQIYVTLPDNPEIASQIASHVLRFSPRVLPNLWPEREMLGSVQSALSDSAFQADALMICPVDMPFKTLKPLLKILDAYKANRKGIFCATLKGERGHPLLITHHFFDATLLLNPNDSLHTLMQAQSKYIIHVECDDENVVVNINTPEDYARFAKPSLKIFDAAATEAPGVKFV